MDTFNGLKPLGSNSGRRSTRNKMAESATAPDWSLVPFEVHCARCGHDLFGLDEPTCPCCDLHFEWADAVPLEEVTCPQCEYHLFGLKRNRCPECGTDFTWDKVLAHYRAKKKPLFEYAWRKRFFRSLFGTWLRSFFPNRFWSQIDLHDPVRKGPLLFFLGLSFLVLNGGMVAYSAICFLPVSTANQTPSVLETFGQLGVGWFLRNVALLLSWEWLGETAVVVMSWIVCSLAALLIYRQSMKRFRVQFTHLLRVWAYALAPMLSLFPAVLIIVYVGLFELSPPAARSFEVLACTYLPALIVLAHATWSVACAYRQYLQMPHSFLVALASQVMAILGALLVADLVLPGHASASILHDITSWLGV